MNQIDSNLKEDLWGAKEDGLAKSIDSRIGKWSELENGKISKDKGNFSNFQFESIEIYQS